MACIHHQLHNMMTHSQLLSPFIQPCFDLRFFRWAHDPRWSIKLNVPTRVPVFSVSFLDGPVQNAAPGSWKCSGHKSARHTLFANVNGRDRGNPRTYQIGMVLESASGILCETDHKEVSSYPIPHYQSFWLPSGVHLSPPSRINNDTSSFTIDEVCEVQVGSPY